MRLALALVLAGLAWPQAAWALTPGDARHLLARTGFAPTRAEIAALLPQDRDQAIEYVLGRAHAEAQTPPPAWVNETELKRPPKAGLDRRKKFQQRRRRQAQELAGWWAREMLQTRSPITERMTLFWHGHLPSSRRKVKNPALLYRQNVLLRRHALGSYRALLHAITADPAMLLYLDGAQNRRGWPNENYARELMELFTIGEGRYTEQDVKETARALTGWRVDRATGAASFQRHRHDPGVKTIRGRTGQFTPPQVVDALLDDPETARRLATKLWRHLVSDTPDPAQVEVIAQRLRNTDYDVKGALRALLRSEAFWASRGQLIKSPVELLFGAARQLEVPVARPVKLARQAARLGQALFDPPNVKGWPGGTAWVSESTYLARAQALRGLLPEDWAEVWLSARPPAEQEAARVQAELLAAPPTDVELLDPNATPALVRQLIADPAYQVN